MTNFPSSYDAIFIGSLTPSAIVPSPQALFAPDEFIREAWSHGKAIGAFGNGSQVLSNAGITTNSSMGVYVGDAATVTTQVLNALSGPVRFPWRFPVDSPSICQ